MFEADREASLDRNPIDLGIFWSSEFLIGPPPHTACCTMPQKLLTRRRAVVTDYEATRLFGYSLRCAIRRSLDKRKCSEQIVRRAWLDFKTLWSSRSQIEPPPQKSPFNTRTPCRAVANDYQVVRLFDYPLRSVIRRSQNRRFGADSVTIF